MVIQSDPLSLRAYASSSPSSENSVADRDTVPSSERALGSRKTSGSASKEVCMYSTLGGEKGRTERERIKGRRESRRKGERKGGSEERVVY